MLLFCKFSERWVEQVTENFSEMIVFTVNCVDACFRWRRSSQLLRVDSSWGQLKQKWVLLTTSWFWLTARSSLGDPEPEAQVAAGELTQMCRSSASWRKRRTTTCCRPPVPQVHLHNLPDQGVWRCTRKEQAMLQEDRWLWMSDGGVRWFGEAEASLEQLKSRTKKLKSVKTLN